ncbi:MAG: hypothetical protein RL567_1659, partial [Bacteroidota bacterium]
MSGKTFKSQTELYLCFDLIYMFVRNLVLCLFMLLPIGLIAQKATISGYVKDVTNGEGLIGASIYIKELKVGNVTNTYGFYSLSVQPGDFTLVFSSAGFAKQERKVTFSGKNQTLNIEMQPESNELAEVKVTAKAVDENVKGIEMSVNKI